MYGGDDVYSNNNNDESGKAYSKVVKVNSV